MIYLDYPKTVETLEEKLESFIAADVSEKGSIISRVNRQNEVLNHNLKQLKMDLEQKERAGFEYEFIGTLWLDSRINHFANLIVPDLANVWHKYLDTSSPIP